MLKYKLKKDPISDFSFSYLVDYLKAVGITQTDSFIKQPRPEDQEPYQNLDNIMEMVKILKKGFDEDKSFFLQVDSDADGYTSAAIFYGFFRRLYPNADIEYRVHNEKEHGVVLDTVPITADYIIIPDAGSNQFYEQLALSRQGREVLIMDHHIYTPGEKIPNVTIVNNQSSPNFKNKSLSGAGVVYKVIQAFNHFYQDEFPMVYEDFADIAAIGIVADMMDTRNLDNNYIIYKGLNNLQNPMIKAILEKREYSVSSVERPNKIDVAFYIAPLINGVVRYGSTEEKELLFHGMCHYEKNQVYESDFRGEVRKENYYDYIARTSTNVQAKQNRDKLKCMAFLKARVEETNAAQHQLVIVKVSKDDKVVIPKTITGLVAMELLKEYKKPVLVLRPRKVDGQIKYAGSGRGKANGIFTSLHGMLGASGYCDYVAGHDMAHGVQIPEEDIDNVIAYANEFLKDVQFEVTEVEVDYVFNTATVNFDMLKEFGGAGHLYGNGIPQPKFAFELSISKEKIRIMGGKRDTIKFSVNGVDFLKFRAKELVEFIETTDADIIKFKVVGRAQINEWGGRRTPQIMLDECDYEPFKLEDLF